MTRLASGIFSRGQRHSDPSDSEGEDDLQHEELPLNPNGGSCSEKPNDIEYQLSKLTTNCKMEEQNIAEVSDLLEIAETLSNLQSPQSDSPPIDEFVSAFKGFDIVRDPSDHYFLSSQGQVSNATYMDNAVSERNYAVLDLIATSSTPVLFVVCLLSIVSLFLRGIK